MLKGYRKRFVTYNMILVGVVLLAAMVFQGVYVYRSSYQELRNTMRLLAEPWDAPNGQFRVLEEGDGPEQDGGPKQNGGPGKDGGRRPEDGSQTEKDELLRNGITTVFYNRSTDEISILSRDTPEDPDAVANAVREIVTLDENFGRLRSLGFIYFREDGAEGSKIVLTDMSYFNAKALKTALTLLAAYIVAMGLLFLISRKLSKLAAKPMEDAIEMERQFVTDISHDLKTPITVVLANNSILRSNPGADADEQLQWLDSTETAAKNMMDMVNEMLTLSSLDSVGRSVLKVPVDLSSAAEKSVLQLESLAYDRGITIDSAAVSEGVTAIATPEYAERICSGLIENALKYEPGGGRVDVSLSAAKKKAVFCVHNYGSFISPEDQPHVFERFYRGDKARSSLQGHGLGLPIIKQMTELIGAQIEMQSGEDGTSFTVTFDCAE
ncbi:MAG: HAMP domain-containing histidine kinase [Oscillospiraceae bacterium]|nr:HAMP domain-containing histidine kinase [Oscillospiraceae bacterium]